ncbi:MAG: hypothetical protein M0R38_07340 [Bacteroidia bacterium]|nr:hypothetical protein [Bacteroidia bacterium]
MFTFANVKKWILSLLLTSCVLPLIAQQQTFIPSPIPFRSFEDSTFIDSNKSLIQLADTFFKAIVNKKKEYLLNNTPTWSAYQQFLDSTAKQKYSETTFRYKFLLFKSGLNKQFKRLFKDAKNSNINLKKSEPIHFFLEQGIHPDFDREFCYLNLEMKRNAKDKIRIRILLLKMDGNWYFADELRLIIIKKKN